MGLKSKLKEKSLSSNFLNRLYIIYQVTKIKISHFFVSDKAKIKRRYKKIFNKKIDLANPKTLNEKICWLKLNDHRQINQIVADKYAVRDYYKENFGEDHLIPLLFHTNKIKEINEKNINKFPCIIKYNGGSGTWKILKNKEDINWKKLRNECKRWRALNHYYYTQEWQYKHIKPMFIVEQLLQDENNKLPNDYKLHYINGKLEFVYCSIDREGGNYRVCYDANWNKLPFTWVEPYKHRPGLNDTDIIRPRTLDKMIEIGNVISKNWPYVRVDFYEVGDKLYHGEVTLHHGSGNDTFEPKEFDLIYGEKVDLNYNK